MRVSVLDSNVLAFPPHAYKMRRAMQGAALAADNSITYGVTDLAAADKFLGGLTAPDGTQIFIPYSYGKVGRFNPLTGMYSDGAAVNAGSARYRNGCYHPQSGLMVFAPLLSPNIGLYDPVADIFTLGVDVGVSPGYHGAIVSSRTGKVVLIPGTKTTIDTYDVTTNTVSTGPAHGGSATVYFSSAEELPDGRILFVPYSAGKFVIYDPVANTCIDGPIHSGGAQYHGSVKLPSGDVVCVPYSAPYVTIYRPRTNDMLRLSIPSIGARFRGGALAPDGRVIFAPHTYDAVGWYDPSKHTYAEGVALGLGAGSKYAGAVAAIDGTVTLVPYVAPKVGRFKPNTSGALPLLPLQSIHYNKG